jgi:hypothetical protein
MMRPHPLRTRALAPTLALLIALGLSGCWAAVPTTPSDSGTRSVPVEDDDDFGTVEVYSVLDDGALDPEATGLAAHVWDTFTRVVTPAFAGETITQFRAGDNADSDTLAYVYQEDDPDYWVLAANLATSEDDTQLIATLIHEYAHILTLDTTQLDTSGDACPTLTLDEGCAGDGSLVYEFEQLFWSGYTDSPDATNGDADLAWEFYQEHEDDFVSDYAATNVVEDVAETFMTFVLEDEPDGDSVIAQKILFFWQQPDLVAIRERIRDEFAAELGLG